MSNTSKSSEFDQVMSSVRKLVIRTETAAVEDGKMADEDAGRYLLTPSLRVDQQDAAQTEASDNAPDVAADRPVEPDNVLPLERIKPRQQSDGLEATIAQLEAAVTAQPDEWEADEGEVFAETDWADSAFASQTEAEQPTEEPKPETSIGPFTDPAVTAEVEAAFIAMKSADPDPDPFLQENRDDAAAFPDDQDPLPKQPEFTAGLPDFFDNPAALDNAVLREMIVDIVREELSGEMGEKITRNVRKLVRREINQILSAKNLI